MTSAVSRCPLVPISLLSQVLEYAGQVGSQWGETLKIRDPKESERFTQSHLLLGPPPVRQLLTNTHMVNQSVWFLLLYCIVPVFRYAKCFMPCWCFLSSTLSALSLLIRRMAHPIFK